MEPEGSLQRSQDPSTGPYPEPDRFSPYHPILSLSRMLWVSNIILNRDLSFFDYKFLTFPTLSVVVNTNNWDMRFSGRWPLRVQSSGL
jgi:hypothetical protein